MPARDCRFEVKARRGRARCASFVVRGRPCATPAFMPVGTQGSVKGVHGETLVSLGYQAVLANTYHLHLRPGEHTVAALGGVHGVLDFPGIVLTDSGGFQVFSLAERRTLDDDGVTFRSHLDGDEVRLTPESAMEVQHHLNSDIAMVLDECPAADAGEEVLQGAVERSLRWAERSRLRHRELSEDRAVFGIVQGGRDASLRASMAAELARGDYDGLAIGGVSVGETAEAIREQVRDFAPLLPEDRPRYLMGVSSPRELTEAVLQGVDLFDCVMPTRNARNGYLYTRYGVYKSRHAAHSRDPNPVEDDCPCALCRRYSRGTLRHLFLSREMLAPMLATEHNLVFYARLLSDLRRWIAGEDDAAPRWLSAYGMVFPSADSSA